MYSPARVVKNSNTCEWLYLSWSCQDIHFQINALKVCQLSRFFFYISMTWFDWYYSVTVLGSRVPGRHLVWPSTLCLTRIQRTSWTKSPPNTWRNWPYSAPRSVNSLLDSVGSRPKLETAQARSLYDLDLKLVARQVDLVLKQV